jgi:hypothetical protein
LPPGVSTLVGKTLFLLALPAHFPDGINSSLPFPRAESEALRTGFRRKPDIVPMIADSR